MKQEPNKELKQTTTYTFQYDSDLSVIDLNTLLVSQIHFSALLNEIKSAVAPDSNLSIKIKPLKEGSVPFDIILDLTWLESLFTTGGLVLNYAGQIIGTLVGIIELRKFLKGKKPDKIEIKDDKVIIHLDGVSIEIDKKTYNTYEKKPIIDQSLKKAFEVIEKDENVDGIKIKDDKEKVLVNVPRNEFVEFTEPNEIFDDISYKEDITNQALTVNKLVFEKGYKWQFYLNGRKISAYVKDDEFMDRIDKGEKFAKGDTLITNIEVDKIFDETLDIYVDNEYTVTKILKHIPRGEQIKLFGNEQQE
jgi:hypothetical protein